MQDVLLYAILQGIRCNNTLIFLILWALYAYTPYFTIDVLLVAECKVYSLEAPDILAIACNIRRICNAVFLFILFYP